MACKSVDELLTPAKSEGVELTREQAETYFSQLSKNELTAEELAKVAGGAESLINSNAPDNHKDKDKKPALGSIICKFDDCYRV